MAANCEHRMHFALARRGAARRGAVAPTRLVDPRELAEELAPGCFRKLRATARVHLDTVDDATSGGAR